MQSQHGKADHAALVLHKAHVLVVLQIRLFDGVEAALTRKTNAPAGHAPRDVTYKHRQSRLTDLRKETDEPTTTVADFNTRSSRPNRTTYKENDYANMKSEQ